MMENQRFFSFSALAVQLMNIAVLAFLVYGCVAVAKALRKYLCSARQRRESVQTLGQCIRQRRMQLHMTQEFVAESMGVSRQAVSKWESGQSDPSTAHLIALARLMNADAAAWMESAAKSEK